MVSGDEQAGQAGDGIGLAGARQLKFVLADDGPVLTTSGAAPTEDHGIALDDGFQLHFGVGTAVRALFRDM